MQLNKPLALVRRYRRKRETLRLTLLCGTILTAALAAGCQDQATDDSMPVAVNQEALVIGGSPEGHQVNALHEPVAEHCLQEALLSITDRQDRALEAFECGDELFEVQFNALDGSGAQVGDGQRYSRLPRADKKGPGEWFSHFPERATGPNAAACTTCHLVPPTGAGPAALNVIRDPLREGNISTFINRNTPHLMGSGALQLLAEEMTTELKEQVKLGRKKACKRRRAVRVKLKAKGVRYGAVKVPCEGAIKTHWLRGIADDLIVRPFQWKGLNASLRDFNRGAAHNEIGMQAVELAGDDVDGDGDGITNEFGIGDMTAMAVYIAGQARPVTKLELDDLGLMGLLEDGEPLTAEERTAIKRGERLFSYIGCASCHKPRLLLDDPMFSEPSQHPDYRDAVFPAGQDPFARGVDPDNAVLFDLTQDHPDNVFEVDGEEVRLGSFETNGQGQAIVRLYGDLKYHDMGARLAENVDETGTGASTWLTKELWGLGSTAPYLHDGRATTVTEAILEHGGEAKRSRYHFSYLKHDDQAALVAFLENLVLIKVE